MTKPILSARKTPNPTLRTQCLTNLLDNTVKSKRKRKDDERLAAKKAKGSMASNLPQSSTMTAIASSNKAKGRVVDVFGGVRSDSLTLCGLSGKKGLTKTKIATAAPTRKTNDMENVQGAKASDSTKSVLKPQMKAAKFSRMTDPKPSEITAKLQIAKAKPYTAPKIRPPPPSSYSSKQLTNRQKEAPSNETVASDKKDTHKPNKQAPVFDRTVIIPTLKRTRRDFSRFTAPQRDSTIDVSNLTSADSSLATPSGSSNDVMINAIPAKTNEQEASAPKRILALETIPILDDVKKASAKVTKPKENFIRLNLRNNNGACRGARKSSKSRSQRKKYISSKSDETTTASSRHVTVVGVDAVDDFIDGTFAQPEKKTKTRNTLNLCKGHQEPCKLLKVKKAGPNKGRQFYVCPCPRSEQCGHFQWADDTDEVRPSNEIN